MQPIIVSSSLDDFLPGVILKYSHFQESFPFSTSFPLLIFVNGKSGGGQGIKLINFFQRTLNPHQVFDLMEGGPLPGYVDLLFQIISSI